MRQRAFTLIELLVAMAITMLLAGLLLTATTSLLQAWRRTQGDAAVAMAANLVLDQIERDLQSAVFRANGNIWLDGRMLDSGQLPNHGWDLTAEGVLKPDAESVRLLPEPNDDAPSRITDARFGRSGLWLRFVTADREGNAGTVPVAVGYQIVRRNVASTVSPAYRYGLFRTRMSSVDTFNFVLGPGLTDDSPTSLISPTLGDLLASNAVDFGIWLATRDVNGVEQPVYPAGSLGQGVKAGAARGVVWVMVRILTEEGANLIEALERGHSVPPPDRSTGDWWWEQAEAHSRVFIRRIELKGAYE
jgi:prepilin-type N-terminal cleavage/methylation domain-containing protein